MRKKINPAEINSARGLKQKGYSISEIAKILDKSDSTIASATKGVAVDSKYVIMWKAKIGGSALRAQKRRELSYEKVSKMVGDIASRDRLIIAACLYWGEGNKKEFTITNSDPALVRVFLQCLYDLGLDKKRLKITIRIYEDIDQEGAEKYWASVLQIPRSRILTTHILKGKKVGKLEYGMCRVRIEKGNDYFNLFKSTIELISKSPYKSPL